MYEKAPADEISYTSTFMPLSSITIIALMDAMYLKNSEGAAESSGLPACATLIVLIARSDRCGSAE